MAIQQMMGCLLATMDANQAEMKAMHTKWTPTKHK
jgi:hypothetical protein